jgi:signal peptidase I
VSSAWRLVRTFAEALIAGLLVGLMLLLLVPVALGWRPYTVLTGSMRPNINPGDVVMDQPIVAADVHVGDVVTFSDPSRRGKLVTHRVRSIARGAAGTTVETRGDANNTSERWSVQTKDQVGRVVFVIPKVGHIAVLVRTPLGIGLLVVLPVLGLGFFALRAIWRDDDEDEPDGDGGAEHTGEQGPADEAGDSGVAESPSLDASAAGDR